MVMHKNISEILFQWYQRKLFLHCIITEDEKSIYFESPKHNKSWRDLGTLDYMNKPLWQECDVCLVGQKDIFKRSLFEKLTDYQKRQQKIIFLNEQAQPHTAKPVCDLLEVFSWEDCVWLTHQTCLLINTCFYWLVTHLLINAWFIRRWEKMAWWMVHNKRGTRVIHKLPKRWGKWNTRGNTYNKWNTYFEYTSFYHSYEFNVFCVFF